MSDCYAGGGLPIESSILPLLKNPCWEIDWPPCYQEIHRCCIIDESQGMYECTSHVPLPRGIKVAHSGFETERRSMSPKVQNRGTSGPTKEHMSTKNFIKTRLHCSGMPTIC